MYQRVALVGLVLLLSQVAAACNGAGSSPGTATTNCPIPNAFSRPVSGGASGEVSSVTVKAGDDAVDERTSPESPWCDLTELSVTKLQVATAVSTNGCPYLASDKTLPCEPYGMLAAVEIEPTPVRFPVSATRPALVYDLTSNPPQKECGEGCGLRVYQLRNAALGWLFVGTATTSTQASTGRPIATASLSHFSVFALVEFPDPEPIAAGAADAVLVVVSDFIDEDPNDVTVQLTFRDGGIETSRPLEEGATPLFRFGGVELRESPDPACEGTGGAVLTCLFPRDTEIHVTVPQDGLVVIERLSDGLRIEFAATLEVL